MDFLILLINLTFSFLFSKFLCGNDFILINKFKKKTEWGFSLQMLLKSIHNIEKTKRKKKTLSRKNFEFF